MQEPEKNDEPKTQPEVDKGGPGSGGKTRIGSGGAGNDEWPFNRHLPDSSKTKTIVCCQNDLLRRGLCAMMSPIALIVAEVVDTSELIYAAGRFAPKVLILDPDFDNVNLIEICRRLLDISSTTSILIFGDSYVNTRYHNQLIRAGVKGFCLSRSNIKTLYDAFEQCARGLPYCDPDIVPMVVQTPAHVLPHANLTDREIEVLIRLDMRNKEIAEELDVKLKTVEKHIECIQAKLKVPTRTAAALKAVQLGYTLLPKMSSRDSATGKTAALSAAEELARWAIVRSGYKGRIWLNKELTVKELAQKLSVIETEIKKRLMMKGFMRTVHQIVEIQLAKELVLDMGFTVDPPDSPPPGRLKKLPKMPE
jgi:DNA-binding NarL/FixJ family response regulator